MENKNFKKYGDVLHVNILGIIIKLNWGNENLQSCYFLYLHRHITIMTEVKHWLFEKYYNKWNTILAF